MSNLDRLVAERVMNWRTHARNTAWWVDADVENGLVPSGGVRGLTSGIDRWSPSTSIKTAWEVVEHLRKQRSAYDAPTDPTWRVSLTGSGDRWICDVADWRERLDVSACDKEPCVAICWAALRAVKVDEATIQEAMR